MNIYALMVAGGLALVFLALARDASASTGRADSEGTDVPTNSFAPSLMEFAEAIAVAEGFYAQGSVPQRAHNPGDLKLSSRPKFNDEGISQFDTDDQGWHALYEQLQRIADRRSRYYTPDTTIAAMGVTWVGDKANGAHWANNVAGALNTDVSAAIGNWIGGLSS